jgi:hypothetical protein
MEDQNNIEELENFKLIWLDKTFYYSDKSLTAKTSLRQITPYLKTFFHVDECFNYVLNTQVDYIILIISIDSFDDTDILTKASLFIQITHLYVIGSSNLSDNDNYPKNVRAIVTNEQDLIIQLSEDIRYCTQNTIKLNIFTSPTECGKSIKDLSKQSTKFLWFQYVLDIEPGVTKFFGHGHGDSAMVTVTVTTIINRDRDRESRACFRVHRD